MLDRERREVLVNGASLHERRMAEGVGQERSIRNGVAEARNGPIVSSFSKQQLVAREAWASRMSFRLAGLYTAAASCVLLLSGCTGSPRFSLLPGNLFSQKATPATPDRCSTPEECAAELKKMVKDPKRD
ncbi:MAG: hypothetical protein HC869_19730 [Rhodospirillales bacterium]|nr:hypothetical protein [Rhodospirillales bacterium]